MLIPIVSFQRLEFLDLSHASEPEKRYIERLLYAGDGDLRLPWVVERHIDEGVVLEGSEDMGHSEPEQPHPDDWASQVYGKSYRVIGSPAVIRTTEPKYITPTCSICIFSHS